MFLALTGWRSGEALTPIAKPAHDQQREAVAGQVEGAVKPTGYGRVFNLDFAEPAASAIP